MEDLDLVLVECELARLRGIVSRLEEEWPVHVIKEPQVCLTEVRAEDSLEQQEFMLGEALTTECEVTVGDLPGYGACLGDEPQRAYCLAVIDALVQADGPVPQHLEAFLQAESETFHRKEEEAFSRTLRTKVDFKLMDDQT